MLYYSLGKTAPSVNFKTAAITGQAPDKGLYFPSSIPQFTKEQIERFKTLDKASLAFEVMKPYVAGTIDDVSLLQICKETIDFDFPLVSINNEIQALELFHGPTLAFKDVGARFMSRCLGYFAKAENAQVNNTAGVYGTSNQKDPTQDTTILVATSGDTGGAVANGFLAVAGVQVIILYPKGKVSPIQALQLTTCGQNITALEVEGSFDDCQAMVKEAFMDTDLTSAYRLTSANSINIARWLPQQLYYFFAWQQWVAQYGDNVPMHIVVPSGNFGNICAGMLAKGSGLPLGKFIAACNSNNVVTRYLATEQYTIQPTIATVSNAMDVGNPSNFVRVMEIMQQANAHLNNTLCSYSYTDTDTKETIRTVYENDAYILDPHGAVAFAAAATYIKEHPNEENGAVTKCLILATAHPVKFPAVVEAAIGKKLIVPASVQYLLDKPMQSIPMEANFEAFKKWMLGRV